MLLNLLIFAGSAGVGEMAARLAAMAGMQCFDYALFWSWLKTSQEILEINYSNILME